MNYFWLCLVECDFTEMGELTHGERRRQGLTCPPDSAPAPAEVLPRGPSEVEEEEEEEEEGVGGKEEEEGELS